MAMALAFAILGVHPVGATGVASAQGDPEGGGGSHRKILYAEPGGHPLELDVHFPALDGTPKPALILVHGGGWRRPGRSEMAPPARAFRDELQIPVFLIDYRLDVVPSGFPAEVEDVETAVRWVRENAARYDVDPERLALVGSSAGANLALVAALRATGSLGSGTRVAAVVSWSAPVDLVELAPVLPRQQVQGYLGCEPDACPDLYRAASPLTYIDRNDPPVFVANSMGETIPGEQALLLARALMEKGVTTEVALEPGTRHGRGLAVPTHDRVSDFLRRALRLPGAPPAPPPPDLDALEAQLRDAATVKQQQGAESEQSRAPKDRDDAPAAPTDDSKPAPEAKEPLSLIHI